MITGGHQHGEGEGGGGPAGEETGGEQERGAELRGRDGEGKDERKWKTEEDDFGQKIPLGAGAEVGPSASDLFGAMEPRHANAETQPEEE